MAIKNGIFFKMAEIGKIKIGGKSEKEYVSKSGRKYHAPIKFDHFIITTTQRDKAGNLIINEKETAKIKNNPRELRIRLPFDSIDKNFFTEYQMYGGKKCLCRGDGEYATRIATKDGIVNALIETIIETTEYPDGQFVFKTKEIEVKSGDSFKIICDPKNCKLFQEGKCKVCGILSAFLTDSKDIGGVYKFRTHSINSVSSISAALKYFSDNTGGILQGLPLKMIMLKKTTEEHGDIDYVTIIIDSETIMGLRTLALTEKESRAKLGVDVKQIESQAEQAGFFKDNDDPETIQAEFYAIEDDEIIPEEKKEKGVDSNTVKENLEKKIEKEAVKKEPETNIKPGEKQENKINPEMPKGNELF
jgi:hypothetical protein